MTERIPALQQGVPCSFFENHGGRLTVGLKGAICAHCARRVLELEKAWGLSDEPVQPGDICCICGHDEGAYEARWLWCPEPHEHYRPICEICCKAAAT